MTIDTTYPAGLLTNTERETLYDPNVDSTERAAVCERVRTRLRATLHDCQALYPTLRDADIEAVFCPDGDAERSTIRAATQDAVGLLALGMLWNDDHIEMRVADAIRYAGFAYGEEVSVTVEVRRSPMPTPEQWLTQRRSDELMTGVTLFEHLLWDKDVPPAQIAKVGQQVGEDTSIETVQETRATADWINRAPQTAILSVEVSDVDAAKHSDDDEFQTDP